MKYKSSRIIDSHQHVFWHGKDDGGLIADMDEQGVDQAWLLTWEIAPSESPAHYTSILNPTRVRPDGTLEGIPLADLLIAKNNYPDRFILGFCPHPLIGDACARLRAGVKMHGVRVCGEWKFRMPFDDPRCIKLFRTAGELGLPVVLHLDVPFLPGPDGAPVYQENWYGGTVDNLERALQACPQTNFIGHAPGFWREIAAGAESDPEIYPKGAVSSPGAVQRLLREYGNLSADLSAESAYTALKRDIPHARQFLKDYSHKLLFARDYYGGDLHELLMSLDLDGLVLESIYHRNAANLVGIVADGASL
jgi:predicted TIM-barrel fold metal-dependent hydrolase